MRPCIIYRSSTISYPLDVVLTSKKSNGLVQRSNILLSIMAQGLNTFGIRWNNRIVGDKMVPTLDVALRDTQNITK
jgi:hypothetical protein